MIVFAECWPCPFLCDQMAKRLGKAGFEAAKIARKAERPLRGKRHSRSDAIVKGLA